MNFEAKILEIDFHQTYKAMFKLCTKNLFSLCLLVKNMSAVTVLKGVILVSQRLYQEWNLHKSWIERALNFGPFAILNLQIITASGGSWSKFEPFLLLSLSNSYAFSKMFTALPRRKRRFGFLYVDVSSWRRTYYISQSFFERVFFTFRRNRYHHWALGWQNMQLLLRV